MKLTNLQNGSDIRGVASENPFCEEVTLTQEVVALFARGFVQFLETKWKRKIMRIAVGHDSRIQAKELKQAIIQALMRSGVEVLDCGLASTPSMFMSCIFEDVKCDGAIMITASHLPWHRNGMKFFDGDGGLNKEDISEIIAYAQDNQFVDQTNGTMRTFDLIKRYSEHLKDIIRKQVNHKEHFEKPLQGLHIVVDAGNGAGGFYATEVLQPLGAKIEGSLYLEADGMFPNHIPNPEDKTAMDAIVQAVLQNKADLGIIFDTDVDRSSAVDAKGCEINRNAIIAMAAALICKQYPHTTIVTDSVTSDELHIFLEDILQVKHHRFKRGYKNVINEAIALNKQGIDSQLAIETSGHGAFKENYFLDDGAYLATKIVIQLAKHKEQPISKLIEDLQYPLSEKEFRFAIHREDFASYAETILQDFKAWILQQSHCTLAKENYEGYRYNTSQETSAGWCLLRKSLHDPLLSLQMESKKTEGCALMGKELLSFFSQYQDLDIKELYNFLNKVDKLERES